MQNKRRTITQALTSEQQAFLRGAPESPLPLPLEASGVPADAITLPAMAISESGVRPGRHPIVTHRETPVEVHALPRRSRAAQSVTLRLHEPIARALRDAAIRRSLDYHEPYTQQGITEAALAAWLKHNGHPIQD